MNANTRRIVMSESEVPSIEHLFGQYDGPAIQKINQTFRYFAQIDALDCIFDSHHTNHTNPIVCMFDTLIRHVALIFDGSLWTIGLGTGSEIF